MDDSNLGLLAFGHGDSQCTRRFHLASGPGAHRRRPAGAAPWSASRNQGRACTLGKIRWFRNFPWPRQSVAPGI